jgi:hypothetical protein
MAKSHTDHLRDDLAEIRRSVDEFRRELGMLADTGDFKVTHTVKRSRGGALRAFRSSRRSKTPIA